MYGIYYEDCDIVHNNFFKLNSIIRKKISLSDVVQAGSKSPVFKDKI